MSAAGGLPGGHGGKRPAGDAGLGVGKRDVRALQPRSLSLLSAGSTQPDVARAKSREAGPSSQETLVGRRGLVRKGSQGEGGGPFVGIQVF